MTSFDSEGGVSAMLLAEVVGRRHRENQSTTLTHMKKGLTCVKFMPDIYACGIGFGVNV